MKDESPVPSNDELAEMAVLGSMLVDTKAAQIAVETVNASDFYTPRHRTLFGLLVELHATVPDLDPVCVRDEIARRGISDQVGGSKSLGRIMENTPSPSNIEHYCNILKRRSKDRQTAILLQIHLNELSAGIQNPATVGALVDALESGVPTSAEQWSIKSLINYNTEDDAACLLGRRWLCRSGAALLVALAGVGKSTLLTQAAILWALGRDLFGLAPVRPLRILIVQAENDAGDAAEMVCGVVNVLGLAPKDVRDVNERVTIIRQVKLSGLDFLTWLRSAVQSQKFDVVFLDPLFAFAGGNVSDQETMSRFLRNGLNSIAVETGCAFLVAHHEPKPPRDPLLKKRQRSEYTYAGHGSAELANWARATLVLEESGEHSYQLVASKRGGRAGLTDPNGQPTRSVILAHSTDGLCWIRSSETDPDSEEVEETAKLVVEAMPVSTPVSKEAVRDLVMKTTGAKRATIYKKSSKINRIWMRVLELTRNPNMPSTYLRVYESTAVSDSLPRLEGSTESTESTHPVGVRSVDRRLATGTANTN